MVGVAVYPLGGGMPMVGTLQPGQQVYITPASNLGTWVYLTPHRNLGIRVRITGDAHHGAWVYVTSVASLGVAVYVENPEELPPPYRHIYGV
jgi:hypothetical protein